MSTSTYISPFLFNISAQINRWSDLFSHNDREALIQELSNHLPQKHHPLFTQSIQHPQAHIAKLNNTSKQYISQQQSLIQSLILTHYPPPTDTLFTRAQVSKLLRISPDRVENTISNLPIPQASPIPLSFLKLFLLQWHDLITSTL